MNRSGGPRRRSRYRASFPGLRRLFHIGRYRPDPERELDEELGFHLQETVEELRRQGMGPEQARAEAERRFGDLSGYRSRLERIDQDTARMARWEELFFVLRQNIIHAARSLRRSPGFTTAVITILALGIGTNAAMFGILDRIFLSPPGQIRDAQEIRRVYVTRTIHNERTTMSSLSCPDYTDFATSGIFSAVAAQTSPLDLTLDSGENATRVRGVRTTAGFLPLLGVQTQLGRFFLAEDERNGAPGAVVLGHGFWQQRFGADTSILGRTLELDGGAYTIIGVMPPGFTGVDLARVDVWLPLQAPADVTDDARGRWWLQVITRMKPETGDEAATVAATLRHLQGHRERIEAGIYDAGASIILGPIMVARGPLAGRESRVIGWLAGVSLILLLIACANVANLLLARSLNDRRDTAVRLVLGISRRRLLGQTASEAVLLALMGGAVSLLLVELGAPILQRLLLPTVHWAGGPVGGRVVSFTFIASIVTGLAAGIVPALQSIRTGLGESLKGGDRGSSVRHSRTRYVLTAAQVSLSTLLLIGAGLFVRSLTRVNTQDLGMEVRHLAMIRLEMTDLMSSGGVINERYEQVARRLRDLPGIEGVGITTVGFTGILFTNISIPGRGPISQLRSLGPYFSHVDPGYFSALGITLQAGREFTAGDGPDGLRAAIINETMARTLWPGEDALGKQFFMGLSRQDDRDPNQALTVVGVVDDVSLGRAYDPVTPCLQFYLPLALTPATFPAGALHVRTADEITRHLALIRTEAMHVDPAIRFANVQTFQELLAPEIRAWSLGASMFAAFGLLAMIVAATGLYSVLACSVVRRTRELGIRTALGAHRRDLVGRVLREGLRLAMVGLGLGLIIALAVARYVQPLLFEVSATDPVVYGTIVAVLLLTALAAGGLPAWRVSRLDPVTALRSE